MRVERTAPEYIDTLDEVAVVRAALETAAENSNQIDAALTRAEALPRVLSVVLRRVETDGGKPYSVPATHPHP